MFLIDSLSLATYFPTYRYVFQKPEGAFFEGECVPNLDDLEEIYTNWKAEVYPHAWRGAILCFTLGLFVCVLTGTDIRNFVHQSFIADLSRIISIMSVSNAKSFCRPVRSLDHLLSTMHLLFRVHRVWIIAILCINIVHPRINRLRCRLGFKHGFASKLTALKFII